MVFSKGYDEADTSMTTKRILMIHVTSAIGGGPEVAYQLVRGIAEINEFSVIYVAPNDGPYFEKIRPCTERIIDLQIRKWSWRTWFKLAKSIIVARPKAIHSHGRGAAVYARVLGFLFRIPVIHTFHLVHYPNPKSPRTRIMMIIENLMAYLSRNIFVSNGEKSNAEKLKLMGFLNNSKVILNGIDIDALKNQHLKILNKGSLSRCLIIAQICYRKGFDRLLTLLRCLKQYRDILPPIHITVAGAALHENIKFEQELITTIKTEGLEEWITFLGNRLDRVSLLQKADIFLSFSRSEGLPLTIIEAMAAELLIIASDVTGNRDLIQHNINGLIFSEETMVEDILSFFKTFNSEHTNYQGLTRQALMDVQKYSYKRMTEEYLNEYRNRK